MGQNIKRVRRRSNSSGLPRTSPRVLCCFLPLLLLFFILIGRAVVLQLLPHQQLDRFMHRLQPSSMALAQTNRGMIFDRHGRELAVNIQSKSIYIDPLLFKQNENYRRELSRIAQLTQQPYATLLQKLNQAARFFWVQRHADVKVAEKIKQFGLSGVNFVEESKRSYPNGVLAAHVLGFTNLDGDGIEGLEVAYDKLLSGERGLLLGQRDAKGRKLMVGGIEKQDHPGTHIYSTIDSVIQYIVERELERVMSETGASGSIGIVMDPNSGEILALANRPTFDPNNYQKFNRERWRNRAVSDSFEPGSTFKSVMVSYALEQGVINERDRFFCKPGSLVIQRHKINELHKHEWLTTREVLKYSSNIGAAKIALLLGAENMREMMRQFGFGEKTQIGLPGEAIGLIQPPSRWTDYDTASAGFGQGIGVTAIQMIRAYAALINGGNLLQPYIADRAVDPENGNTVVLGMKREQRRAILPETAENIGSMLAGVVDEHGTGNRAALINYSVGGKTGTAQRFDNKTLSYQKNDYTTSFIGYFPVHQPQLLILVVVDQPQGLLNSGALVAAPVFRRIAEQAGEYLHIEADRPTNLEASLESKKSAIANVNSNLAEPAKSGTKTFDGQANLEFKGLTVRQALALAKQQGLEIVVQGSGFATGKMSRDRRYPTRLLVEFEPTAKRRM